MKLSVLMTVYGGESPQFLETSLKSITAAQTRKPDQVVLVVDGPVADELKSVIHRCTASDKSVEVVWLPQNLGQGGASKAGLRYCRHELIARMDSDDISLPERFETQLAVFERNPSFDVVGGFIGEFEAAEGEVKRIRRVPEKDADIKRYFRFRNAVNNVSVMMKKTAVFRAGGYNDKSVNEDYSLYTDMLINGAVFYNIQKVLVHVRVGSGMAARRAGLKVFSDWRKDQKKLLHAHKTTFFFCLLSCAGCLLFTLAPTPAKVFLYRFVLRR